MQRPSLPAMGTPSYVTTGQRFVVSASSEYHVSVCTVAIRNGVLLCMDPVMRYLLAVLSVLSLGCASGHTPAESIRSSLQATDEPLEPGDMIRVDFSVERQLNGAFAIDETHRVGLPLLGWTDVGGIPGAQLRDSLALAYEAQIRNQTVQITLLRRIRVLGAVQQPGLYHVDPTMSLIDAIALAGGPTQNGKLDGIEIIRGGAVIANEIADTELVGSYVRSGDQIMVPERSWFSRNAGWVVGTAVSASAIIYAAIINSGN
jgi:hypothetical protein